MLIITLIQDRQIRKLCYLIYQKKGNYVDQPEIYKFSIYMYNLFIIFMFNFLFLHFLMNCVNLVYLNHKIFHFILKFSQHILLFQVLLYRQKESG